MVINAEEPQIKHQRKFVEFARAALFAGDPDSHLKLAAHFMREVEDMRERVWLAGCYTGFYNLVSGLVVFHEWPLSRVEAHPEEFSEWVQEHWKGFSISFERRCVRTHTKMMRSLMSFIKNIDKIIEMKDADYETLWKFSLNNIEFYGRYITIKLLEVLYQGKVVSSRIPDIRPIDGWSPRTSLTWFFPEYEDAIQLGGNKPETIAIINELSDKVLNYIQKEVDPSLSHFEVEVWLCNYRQLYESHHGNYAGQSQDAMLEFYHSLKEHWGEYPFDLLKARKSVFSELVLGEIQGWDKSREELNTCHKEFGYYFSDGVYSYHLSKDDLEHPVKWSDIK